MQNYTTHYSGRNAKQGDKIPGKSHLMTKTSDGAYVFKANRWTRLQRFLILGADGGSYYAGERKLVRENAGVIEGCIKEDGLRTVEMIASLSESGRAPNNDPALFALAMCSALGDDKTRQAAHAALPRVARIGTHLFHFVHFAEALGRGWGRSFKRAIASWYNDKPVADLAYQLIKYKQRDGWAQNDLIQLAHPKSGQADRNALYRWVTWGELGDELPAQVYAAVDILTAEKAQAIKLIREHRLPHECVPNELKDDPKVWEALLESMPLTATIRNLGKMSAVGLLKPMSNAAKLVTARLTDEDLIVRQRVHPMTFLKAEKVYSDGHGDKGKLSWKPVSAIVDALDAGFYKGFKSVVPSGKNTMLCIDISGSMAFPSSAVKGMSGIHARDIAAAMALVTANVEPNYEVFAFCSGRGHDGTFYRGDKIVMRQAPVTSRMRVPDAMKAINSLPAGGTDLAAPMAHAMKEKLEVDTFVVYTDNETNQFNSMQPSLALQKYRKQTGINAKLVVVAMVANNISIADPTDSGMLDVEGFDTSAPEVMADFARDGFGEVAA